MPQPSAVTETRRAGAPTQLLLTGRCGRRMYRCGCGAGSRTCFTKVRTTSGVLSVTAASATDVRINLGDQWDIEVGPTGVPREEPEVSPCCRRYTSKQVERREPASLLEAGDD